MTTPSIAGVGSTIFNVRMRTQQTTLVVLGLAIVASISMLLLSSCGRRPKDASLAQQFYTNRTVFVELKQMLQADQYLHQVADWGVRTTNSMLLATPTAAGLTTERYQKYLNLLHQAGAQQAIHDGTEFRFLIAGSGFASKGYRVAVTWTDTKPIRLMTNLDDFRKTSKRWEDAYRPLGEDWYLWIIW